MIKTCSTGHTGFIHVNALRGGYTHVLTSRTKATSRNQSLAQLNYQSKYNAQGTTGAYNEIQIY